MSINSATEKIVDFTMHFELLKQGLEPVGVTAPDAMKTPPSASPYAAFEGVRPTSSA